jgi:RNA polymerase sigma-70 factor (ECF subfamily)
MSRSTADPEATTRSTEELLSAVALGDERAFELLYDQLAAPVTGMVHAVVQDHSQTEEVVQEVFFQLWQNAPRYRQDRGAARSWVMTVAHRRAVDRVRSAQARVNRERAAQARSYPGRPFDTVLEQVLDNCEWGQVRACLGRLTALEREAILLAYYRALTCRQVAEELGVATGTAKYRMRAGLRRIRDSLDWDPAMAPSVDRTAIAK